VAIRISSSPDANLPPQLQGLPNKEVGSMIETVAAMVFVVATLAVVAYALVRPFTHVHYQHPTDKLWRPLD